MSIRLEVRGASVHSHLAVGPTPNAFGVDRSARVDLGPFGLDCSANVRYLTLASARVELKDIKAIIDLMRKNDFVFEEKDGFGKMPKGIARTDFMGWASRAVAQTDGEFRAKAPARRGRDITFARYVSPMVGTFFARLHDALFRRVARR